MEDNFLPTNQENDKANQKDVSLPILTEQAPSKRIRKRIKYYRKTIGEIPVKTAISQTNENPFKNNIF